MRLKQIVHIKFAAAAIPNQMDTRYSSEQERLEAEENNRQSLARSVMGLNITKASNGCILWHWPFDKDQRPMRMLHGERINVRTTAFRILNPGNEKKPVYNTCGNQRCIAPQHASLKRRISTLEEKLTFFEVTDTGCYILPAKKNGNTQAKIRFRGRILSAAREAYRMHYGEMPRGWEIRHTCGNPSCFNSRHLRAVPPKHERLFREPRLKKSQQDRVKGV